VSRVGKHEDAGMPHRRTAGRSLLIVAFAVGFTAIALAARAFWWLSERVAAGRAALRRRHHRW
jgi:hypothetical protein